jgi:TRAP-type mannitol/chloroaromatic compound transport system permease large subunit
MALTILAISFFGLLVLGVPVAFAIGLSAMVTILYEGLPVAVIFQQMMSGMNIFSFLAIPFFVFSGELMLHGGIADKIVAAAKNAVGHVRGGLACRTWWPAPSSAAWPAHPRPTSRPWVR